jgi:hypothetical protein
MNRFFESEKGRVDPLTSFTTGGVRLLMSSNASYSVMFALFVCLGYLYGHIVMGPTPGSTLDQPLERPINHQAPDKIVFQCPMPWLKRYEDFHKSARGKSGTKYLVHRVGSKMSGGLGDRLRGMLYTVRVAAAANRVAIFIWTHPHVLTNFFEPASEIDWRSDGIRGLSDGPVFTAIDGPLAAIRNGSIYAMQDRVITLQVYVGNPQ